MEKYQVQPILGINSDDAIENMQEGESRMMQNCYSITSVGSGKRIVGVRSNVLHANPDLPAGNNNVIGTCEWPGTRRLIYFLHNNNFQHSIWYYDEVTNLHQRLMQSPILNFDRYLLLDAQVRDGLLYWNQGYFNSYFFNGVLGAQEFAPPRKMNLAKAIAFQNGQPNGYVNMDWQTIRAAKYPYCFSPSCQYTTDPDRLVNNLKYGLYQFRIQYVYDDDEVSRWSPISKVAIPTVAETMEGTRMVDPQVDNRIDVAFRTGHHTVTKINVAFRKGNIGQWYIFLEINKAQDGYADNALITVFFYNDEQKKGVEIRDQNYDLLPDTAMVQCLLHNSTISYANISEGFDKEQLVGTSSYEVNRIPNDYNGETVHQIRYSFTGVTSLIRRIFLYRNVLATAALTGGMYIPMGSTFVLSTANASTGGGTPFNRLLSEFTTTVNYFGLAGLTAFMNAWAAYLNTLGHNATYSVFFLGTNPELVIDFSAAYGAGVQIAYSELRVYQVNTRYLSAKKGTTHVFGIQYYDDPNKDGTVYTSEDWRLYVKREDEEDKSGFDNRNQAYTTQIVLNMTSQPPMWARWYQIVRLSNTDFLSFQHRSVRRVQFDSSANGVCKMSLERNYRDNIPGATYHHEIKVGDRVRLLRGKHPNTYTTAPVVVGQYDFTVMKYDPIGGDAGSEAIWVEFFDFESILDGDRGFLIEIWAQREDQTELVWEEFGETYAVLLPHTANRAHLGQVVGSVPGTAVVGGDVYMRLRRMGSGFTGGLPTHFNWYVEDYHYSDFYVSNDTSKGRLAIFDENAQRRQIIGKGRASDKYIDESNVNGLSRFDALEQFILPPDTGPITKMMEVGFTLKVLTERMNYSIYIDRQETHGASGNTEMMFVKQTFGTIRPHEEGFGAKYGRAVCKVDRQMYYWDQVRGTIIQDSSNGQEDLGLIKRVQKEFDRIKTAIDAAANPQLIMGYDRKREQLYFGYIGAGTTEMFVYNRAIGRWEFFTSYYATSVDCIGDTLYLSNSGQFWSSTGAGRGSIFSVDRSMSASFPVRLKTGKQFAIRTVFVLCDKRPGNGVIGAFATGSYQQMLGFIVSNWWEQYEQGWAAFISGDINDPQSEPITIFGKYFDSREIRGEAILVSIDATTDLPEIRGFEFTCHELG